MKQKIKQSTLKFKKELKKAIVTAITAAFGFLIALVWRDVLIEYVDKLSAISALQGKIIGAITITIICVIGILILSKFASEE